MINEHEVGAATEVESTGTDMEKALDHLLEQVIAGFFVLTDGQGNLSKWPVPAEFLFGLKPDEALGSPMFDKLSAPPLSSEVLAWKRFLEEAIDPGTQARAAFNARHPQAGEFPVEAVFVPVKLDEGFDFSLFLEDLSFELPLELMLTRMRQQHPVVINALRQSLADDPTPWEGWRTAGTLVIFTPKTPTPWIEEAMAAREAERAAAEEEAHSRIQAYEAPGVQGSEIHDLDDAAAVVERLRWATERIEELEERSRIAEGAAFEVAEARKRAEAAEQAALEARAQLTDALTKADAEVVATSEAERLELIARLDRIERAAQEAAEAAAEHKITAERERQRQSEAEKATLEIGRRIELLERDLTATAEASRTAAAERARVEAQAAVDVATKAFQQRLDAIEQARARGDGSAVAEASARAEASRAELQARLEALEHRQQDELTILREEVGDLKVAAADATELRGELKRLQASLSETAGLRSEVARTREEVQALRRSSSESVIQRLESGTLKIGRLHDQLEALRTEAEEARAQSEALLGQSDRTEELRAEIDRLREQTAGDDVRAELERLREATQAVETLRAEVDALRDRATGAESVRDELQTALARVDELAEQSARLRSQIQAAPGLGEEERRRLAEAEREAHEARAAVEALRTQSEDLREDAARLREEAGQLRAQLGELVEGEGHARHDVDALRREQDDIRALLQEARRERDESRQTLTEALRKVEEARSGAAEQAAAEAARAAAVSTESGIRQRFDRTVEEFTTLRREAEAIRGRLVDLSAMAQSAETRADEARAEAAAAREDIQEVREEAREAQRKAREADDRIDQVDRGAAKVLHEVRAQQTELRAAAEALQAMQGDATEAREDAITARSEAAEARGAVDRLDHRLDGALKQYESLTADLESVRGQAAAATEAAEAAREQAGTVREDAVWAAREAAEEVAGRLRDDVEAVRSDLEAARRDLDERLTTAQPGAVEALQADVQSRFEALGAEVEALRAAQSDDDVADDLVALRDSLAILRSDVEERAKADDVRALRADLEAVPSREELAALRTAIQARPAAEAVAGLRFDLDALKERIEDVASAPGASAETLDELLQRVDAMSQSGVHQTAVESLRERVAELEARAPQQVEDVGARLEETAKLVADLTAEVGRLDGGSDAVKAIVDARLAEVSAELVAARTETEAVRRSVDDLRHEMQTVREYAASAKAEGASALQLATTAQASGSETDRRVEEMRGELFDARKLLEELRSNAEEARRAAQAAKSAAERAASAEKGTSERFTEVWDELIKKSRTGSGVRRTAIPLKKPDVPAREPREGFDDQERPMAVLGLDGKFRELNPPFTRLIGYEEHEFTRAAWPSVHDRGVYKQQLAALEELASGERETFEVQSTFMHGQGLMVPVQGEIRLVRDEDGDPDHLLMVAVERQHV